MGVYIALGANLGDRRANLAAALRLLAPEFSVEAVSQLYESEPQPPAPPPSYYNAAARVATSLSPHDLLRHLKDIERRLGRTDTTHWAPRPIDLDLALYDDLVLDDLDLVIPHPRLHERAFVLQPLLDLDPALVHPRLGVTLASLLPSESGLTIVADRGWHLGNDESIRTFRGSRDLPGSE
jgi:2-amino-4-hydroxy-6-hydroxymethyldihydropteridine diphosphokinase